MVFRALAHFHQANLEQETDDLIVYLVEHAPLFGKRQISAETTSRTRCTCPRIFGL